MYITCVPELIIYKKMKKLITITLFVLVIMSSVFSQTNEVGKKYVYEFRDGTTIIGTFIKDEAGNIYITELDVKKRIYQELWLLKYMK